MRRVSSERRKPRRSSSSEVKHSRSLSASYPATSITKHYALNHEILSAFDSLYSGKHYEVAYGIGMQFIETALLEIPKHGYFYSPKHEEERRQSSLEAERVCRLLEDLVGEEAKAEKERFEKLAELARKQAVAPYEPEPVVEEKGSLCSDLMCGQDVITDLLCPIKKSPGVVPKQTTASSPPESASPREGRSLKYSFLEPPEARVEDSTHREEQKQEIMPPTMPRVEWGTSFDYFVRQPPDYLSDEYSQSSDLERALFVSGLDYARMLEDEKTDSSPCHNLKSSSELDITTLSACYHDDFDLLRSNKRVQIFRIPTHQGRLVGSINGCTLIAPLLCVYYFSNESGQGLPDSVIEHVIDEDTSALLPEVRHKLGLTKDALIIPSDVHDFLLDRGLLLQEQFITVCGGNILNDMHVNELMNAIIVHNEGQKIAATIFFHEHVVAILKIDVPEEGGGMWFDLIDSLPYQDMLHPNESCISEDEEYIPYAARIRCTDVEALRATLKWYACSKFDEKDCAYINMYAWDDLHSDFDPRVFQAFVWSEA
jgi:hypothetical protein